MNTFWIFGLGKLYYYKYFLPATMWSIMSIRGTCYNTLHAHVTSHDSSHSCNVIWLDAHVMSHDSSWSCDVAWLFMLMWRHMTRHDHVMSHDSSWSRDVAWLSMLMWCHMTLHTHVTSYDLMLMWCHVTHTVTHIVYSCEMHATTLCWSRHPFKWLTSGGTRSWLAWAR